MDKNKLNENQKKILKSLDQSLLILGSAGTGKTTILGHVIAELIQTYKVKPSSLLVLSYSNYPLKHLKSIVSETAASAVSNIKFETLPLFCASILRKEAHVAASIEPGLNTSEAIIINTQESLDIIRDILQASEHRETIDSANIQESIRLLKQKGLDYKAYQNHQHDFPVNSFLASVFEKYQARLEKYKAMDEDDIYILITALFNTRPALLKKYQNKFTTLIVDHFEGMTPLQHHILELLISEKGRLIAAADIDQIIEGHPNSVYNTLIEFNTIFSGQTITLNQNYRSSKTVLQGIKQLMNTNEFTGTHELYTENENGDSVAYFLCYDELEEARYICDTIKRLKQESRYSLNDFIILVNSIDQKKALETTFIESNLRHKTLEGSILSASPAVQPIIAFLRVIHSSEDVPAIMQVLRLPFFNLTSHMIEKIGRLLKPKQGPTKSLLTEKNQARSKTVLDKLEQILSLISKWKKEYLSSKMSLSTLITTIIVNSGYNAYLESINTLESLEHMETIKELINYVETKKYNLQEFLDHVIFNTNDYELACSGNAVTIMPLRKAKGISAKVVFIVGVEEGLIPHYSSQLDNSALDEERRLFYLGLTRGSDALFITSCYKRNLYGSNWYNEISRFVFDIPHSAVACFIAPELDNPEEKLVKKLSEHNFHCETFSKLLEKPTYNAHASKSFQKGDHIFHNQWGKGTIQKVEGKGENTIFTIEFKDHLRKILAKYAAIENLF
ncbi:ATP-dependent helicase [Thermoproteota archaeon]